MVYPHGEGGLSFMDGPLLVSHQSYTVLVKLKKCSASLNNIKQIRITKFAYNGKPIIQG